MYEALRFSKMGVLVAVPVSGLRSPSPEIVLLSCLRFTVGLGSRSCSFTSALGAARLCARALLPPRAGFFSVPLLLSTRRGLPPGARAPLLPLPRSPSVSRRGRCARAEALKQAGALLRTPTRRRKEPQQGALQEPLPTAGSQPHAQPVKEL
ncbi:hypothetical protein NDU88_007018 [Pleurodeles waltl]|uniref:Uncharacterized protein n=1 Tax=Pleurodeles waltl TaxID=8319 RepID=A0AAV7MHR6_PLEWA|nr:hypothetical protein NDU88_007018 [Pleurodeles waltl]